MKTLVIYDISDDNLRNAISEVCKNFGLLRIQKSAFIGNLTSSRRKELRDKLKEALGDANGNIQLFAICQSDMALREIIGKEVSEEVPSISFV
ncbi:MAG: CRISPR-associated endonuclease Cas2 [Nitrososphaerales archaeon]